MKTNLIETLKLAIKTYELREQVEGAHYISEKDKRAALRGLRRKETKMYATLKAELSRLESPQLVQDVATAIYLSTMKQATSQHARDVITAIVGGE